MRTHLRTTILSLACIITATIASSCGHPQDEAAALQLSAEREVPTPEGIRIIGDSIFSWGGGMIPQILSSMWQKPVASSAISGHKMWQVKEQYYQVAGSNMRTLILDGGGNDVLAARGDCQSSMNPACKAIIDSVGGIIAEVMRDAGKRQIPNVVYLSSHNPTSFNAGFAEAINYGKAVAVAACKNSGANCIVVDPRPALDGHPELLEWDGVHPTRAGAEVFAKVIRDGMVAAGMTP